jgi:hypothetical protein
MLKTYLPFEGLYQSRLDDGFDLALEFALEDDASAECNLTPAIRRKLALLAARYMQEPVGATFHNAQMESPRFYNFETDRIFADVSIDHMRAIVARAIAPANRERLLEVLTRHESYEGFISFYSDDLGHWLARAEDVEALDANECETFILASVTEDALTEAQDDLHEYCACNGVYDEAITYRAAA